MSFIRGLGDGEATGRAAELFDEDMKKDGFVWNLTRVMALRPDVVDAWRKLIGTIRADMDLRRYELVTLAAARALRTSYCMFAHARILTDQFYPAERVAAIARDPHSAGLSAAEIAMMEFAAKVASDANSVRQQDVDGLKTLGFTEREIMDIALAAAARAFFSKCLDGLGVEPDAAYRAFPDELQAVLKLGRPIAIGGTS